MDKAQLFLGQIKQGCVALTSEDVECLQGREWLTDNVIEFYLEYLRQAKYKEHFDKIEIIGPCVAQLLKTINSKEDIIKELESLRLMQRKIVLIPVNNAKSRLHFWSPIKILYAQC